MVRNPQRQILKSLSRFCFSKIIIQTITTRFAHNERRQCWAVGGLPQGCSATDAIPKSTAALDGYDA